MPTNPLYFFSYSRQELYFAESAVVALQKAGLNIWFDLQQLEPGCVWNDEIQRGLQQCEGVILLASRAALSSPWVAVEWEKSLQENKPIYIILFEVVSFDMIPASDKTNNKTIPLDELKNKAVAILDMRRNFQQNITRLAAVVKEQGNLFDPIPVPNRWHIPTRMPIAVALVALSLALMTAVMLWISLYGFSIYWPMLLGGLAITIWLGDRTLAFLQRRSFREPRGLLPAVTLLSPLISLALTPFFAIGALLVHFSADVERWSPLGQGTDRHRSRAALPSRRFRRPEPSGATYQVIAAPEDRRIAVQVEREMRRAGHELVNQSAHFQIPRAQGEGSKVEDSDFTILILSNYIPDSTLQKYAQSDEKVICVAASALDNWDRFKPISRFQFVDYRRQQRRRLAAMALDILNISSDKIGYSFSSHLTPENFGKVIMPARVAGAIGLMYVSTYIFAATTIRSLFTGELSPLYIVINLLTNVVINLWLMIRATRREITVSLLLLVSLGIPIFNIILISVIEPSLQDIDLGFVLWPTLIFNLIFYLLLYGILLRSWLPARRTRLTLSFRRDLDQWRFHFVVALVLALFAVTFVGDRFVHATTPPIELTRPVSYENQLTLDVPTYWYPADSTDYQNATRRQHDFILALERVSSTLGRRGLGFINSSLFGSDQSPVIAPLDMFQGLALPLDLTLVHDARYVPDAAQTARALRFDLWVYPNGFLYADEPRELLEIIEAGGMFASLAPVQETAGDVRRLEKHFAFQDFDTAQLMEFRVVMLDTPGTDFFMNFIGDTETMASETNSIEKTIASVQINTQPQPPVEVTLDNLHFAVPGNWKTVTIPDVSDTTTWEGATLMEIFTQVIQQTQAVYDQFDLPIRTIWSAQIASLHKPFQITLEHFEDATPDELDFVLNTFAQGLVQSTGVQPASDQVTGPRDDLTFRIITFETPDAAMWYIALYVDGQSYLAQIATDPATLNGYADTVIMWLETFDTR